MARFKAGQKKPNGSGRKPGTPNKRSEQLHEIFGKIDFNVPEKLIQLLPTLKPEKQADILIELMGYLYSKRKAIEATSETASPQAKIIVTLPSNGFESKDCTEFSREGGT